MTAATAAHSPRYARTRAKFRALYAVQADTAPADDLIAFARATFPRYTPAPHHRLIADRLMAVERGEIDRLIITMPPRHGKALALDTPIPTPTGWTTMGELRVGDHVFDEQGQPCNVTAVSEVWRDRPVYRVTTDDGDVIVADAEHEWIARLDGKRPVFKAHTTATLAKPRNKRAMIRRQGALDLPFATLPVDPYVLGLWLGDGTSAHTTITAHDDDAPFYRAQIEAAGYPTRDRATKQSFGFGEIQPAFRALGVLRNKHIPVTYLRAHADQRLALLQGLIDSDGYVAGDGQVEFCATNERLAWDVHDLVCSLGRKASMVLGRATIGGKDCGAKYRVMFYLADAARLPRKAIKCRDAVKTPDRYVSAALAGTGDTVCIQVDAPSSMFLCGRSMLPTHNSELASVRFPAWFLGRNPDKRIIATSYGAGLAYRMSRQSRNIVGGPGWPFPAVRLADDLAQVQQWDMDGHRGGYIAAGSGGPITGSGAHLLLIDDPIRNQQDADSASLRDTLWEWYTSTAYTRLEDAGAVILIQTRWHSDDLAGRLLAAQAAGGDQWSVLHLPAIAEDGSALWPEKYDRPALERIKTAVGSRVFAALYQGQPSNDETALLKREWWRYYTAPPARFDTVIQSWDMTFKGGVNNDYVVGQVWGKAGADTYLLAQTRGRLDFPATLDAFRGLTAAWPDARVKLVEDKANGPAVIATLKHEIGGIVPVNPEGGKVARVNAVAGLVEAGNVYLPDPRIAPWVTDFVQEATAFPTGPHDDQVDGMSQALVRLNGPVRRTWAV